MKVKLLVIVDVANTENTDEPDEQIAISAAQEAIYNAIMYGQGQGHVHEHDMEVSILLEKVEAQPC